jgi:hypothetical protein
MDFALFSQLAILLLQRDFAQAVGIAWGPPNKSDICDASRKKIFRNCTHAAPT